MTDKLRESLHAQADSAGLPSVDLDAIVAGGTRVVRRRRRAAVAAGAAVVTAVVALAVALTGPAAERADIAPADPYPTSPRAFAPVVTAGEWVHDGTTAVRLPHPVDRLVRNGDAYVYASDRDDESGVAALHAWADGVTTDLGPGSDLAIDEDGHLAAWVTPGRPAEVVVLDTRTMTTRTIEVDSGDEPVRLHDVDGHTVYFSDRRGGVALDLRTGDVTPIEGYPVDVEDGVVVAAPLDALDEERDTSGPTVADGLVATSDEGSVRLSGTRSGVLSPDGRRFATSDRLPGTEESAGPPTTDVVDTSTGERLVLDTASALPDEPLAVEPTAWLDDDTLSVYFYPADDGPTRLLSCVVSTNSCEVVFADTGALRGAGGGLLTYPGFPPFDRR
jgi:hypothetical protein